MQSFSTSHSAAPLAFMPASIAWSLSCSQRLNKMMQILIQLQLIGVFPSHPFVAIFFVLTIPLAPGDKQMHRYRGGSE